MPSKVEPESLSKLKRKRGQLRFRAREAFVALKSHVGGLQSADVVTVELWQISCLESEIQALEVRVEALVNAHIDVQCASEGDLEERDDRDEDTLFINELQSGLLAVEQDVRNLRYRCEALTPRANFATPDLRRTPRINTSLKPDSLTPDVTLASFHVWRQKFLDFYLSNGMDQFSLPEQRAQLRGCMDVAMIQTISQYLDVSDDEPVVDVLDKIQCHIAKSVNIVRRRHDFNTLEQKPGESFCDLFVRLKLVGSLAELEKISYEEILASRLIVAVSDQELKRELLCLDNPSLAEVKAKCESWEAGGANLVALQDKVVARGVRVSKYKRGKQQNRDQSRESVAKPTNSCGKCGFEEHFGPFCPAKNKVCHGCGKQGHFERMCISASDSIGSSASESVTTSRVGVCSTKVQGVRFLPTPRAEVVVSDGFGVKFEANVLPDSGASHCIFPSKLIRRHLVRVDSSNKPVIKAINGTRLTCDGVVDLQLKWLNHRTHVEAFVSSDVDVPIIGWSTMINLNMIKKSMFLNEARRKGSVNPRKMFRSKKCQ